MRDTPSCSICEGKSFLAYLCYGCHRDGKSLITLFNKLDNDNDDLVSSSSSDNTNSTAASSNSNKGKAFADIGRWIKQTKANNEWLKEKVGFLSGFGAAFRDQIHTDIQVKPGVGYKDDEPFSIAAHKALLAARSDILRNILDSPINDTITLPEMDHEGMKSLLEFLYTGNVPKEKMDQELICSLYVAADKYDIPFLHKFCANHVGTSLNSSNALRFLEMSDTYSIQSLKDTVLDFIVRNEQDIVLSSKFEEFTVKNPHLTVQITRARFPSSRKRKYNSFFK